MAERRNTRGISKVPLTRGAQLAGYLSFFVAGLSLIASFYQGYLNTKYLDIIQKNVSRGEYMRTCKDIVDAYFQIKLKTLLLASATGAASENRETEAANAASYFAALGTYLANLQNETVRARYTKLSQGLSKVITVARKTPPDGIDNLFGSADELFAGMNDDCVRTANMKI
jgi:hypothetical protein